MVKDNILYMSEVSKSRVKNYFSFDGKNLLAGIGLLAILLVMTGVAVSQVSGGPDVSFDSNGVTINTGSLNLNGNAIEGVSLIQDESGDSVAQVDDAQNSLEIQGGFQLPTGADAYQ